MFVYLYMDQDGRHAVSSIETKWKDSTNCVIKTYTAQYGYSPWFITQ
jgi:hypothetical protein